MPGRVTVHPHRARPSYEMFLREQIPCCVCVVCAWVHLGDASRCTDACALCFCTRTVRK